MKDAVHPADRVVETRGCRVAAVETVCGLWCEYPSAGVQQAQVGENVRSEVGWLEGRMEHLFVSLLSRCAESHRKGSMCFHSWLEN